MILNTYQTLRHCLGNRMSGVFCTQFKARAFDVDAQSVFRNLEELCRTPRFIAAPSNRSASVSRGDSDTYSVISSIFSKTRTAECR